MVVDLFFFSSRRRHTRSSTVSWLGDVYKRQVELVQKNRAVKLAGNDKLRIEREIAAPADRAHYPVSYTHLTLPTSDLV